jgi:PAS domain S-box-containing protein
MAGMAEQAKQPKGDPVALDAPLEMFRELCENAQDLIQSVGADGRLLYVNRAWRETLGYSADEVAAMHVFDVIHPDSLEHCQRAFMQVFAGQMLHDVEFAFRTKSGRRVEVLGSAGARIVDGKPLWTAGIYHEVTDARRRDLERQRLFELSLDMLCVGGLDGYFKQVNPAFTRTLKYSREELLSRPFLDFVHPEDRQRTITELEKLTRGEPIVDFINRYRTRDGRYLWISWRAAPLPGLGFIYAVARDITHEKETQALMIEQAHALERSNADLEQFAYTASHDLRAPLRGLDHLVEWIEQDMPGEMPAKVHEHIEHVRQRVKRMDTLIEDLLTYYRSGHMDQQRSQVDTAALVEDIRNLLAPPPGFTIRTEGEMPVFETARAPLELVLRNLIGNAVKHHDRTEGTVTVRVERHERLLAFIVEDDGPGIPREHLERVFAMFSQLKPRDQVEGSGMGLALVRRIVERHGGEIHAQAHEGRGSVFRFTWPTGPPPLEGAVAATVDH